MFLVKNRHFNSIFGPGKGKNFDSKYSTFLCIFAFYNFHSKIEDQKYMKILTPFGMYLYGLPI
jgi:hypothetical protein